MVNERTSQTVRRQSRIDVSAGVAMTLTLMMFVFVVAAMMMTITTVHAMRSHATVHAMQQQHLHEAKIAAANARVISDDDNDNNNDADINPAKYAALDIDITSETVRDAVAAGPTISIDTSKSLITVSDDLWGVFFEEINHAGVAGLYNQQINNSNFEVGGLSYEQAILWNPQSVPLLADYSPWYLLPLPADMQAFISLNQDVPLNGWNAWSIYVRSFNASGTVSLANPGFWGINTIGVSTFSVSFWSLAPQGFQAPSTYTLSIFSNKTGEVYASTTINVSLTDAWQQFTATIKMTAAGTDPAACFSISWPSVGTTMVYFDVVTVFPDDGWNGLPYIRPDLGQMIADMHPAFFRFPGGCYVEGDVLNNRFNWKATIGPIENRRGHRGVWLYYSEDHLGIYEYFSFIEKLTDVYGNPTRPIWVINSGNSHLVQVPSHQLGQWVQDALDSIEFIRGPVTSRYGAIRAAMGHPEPFNLTYISIGNEGDHLPNWHELYAPNYAVFYEALHAAYPDIVLIANADMRSLGMPTEMFDYHIYTSPGYFFNNTHYFDSWARNGATVFNSEYAVTSGCGNGNAIAALGEAAWMTGLERNSDLVTTASYAPLLVNTKDRTWSPDAIVFDTYRAYGTPSYWTQWLFANANAGTKQGTIKTLASTVTSGAPLVVGATWAALNATYAVQYNATTVFITKVVNWYDGVVSATVELANLSGAAYIRPTATVWTIAATSATQENSFDAPTAVAPAASETKIGGATWTYEFAPLSTTIVLVYATV